MEKSSPLHEEGKVKRITLGLIISWILGVLFVIAGITYIGSDVLTGVLYLVGALILLPPINSLIQSKLKFSISGGVKFVLIVIILVIIGSRIASNSLGRLSTLTQTSPSFSSPSPTSTINTTTTATDSSKTYQETFKFNGNGAKTSEPFKIVGDRFKISYDCNGDMCQAFLFPVGSQLPQIIMNKPGSTKDETIFYGTGEYYINSNTIGTFNMTVSDYK